MQVLTQVYRWEYQLQTLMFVLFHCHTTLHYCPKTTSRRTGPSQNDLDLAQSYNLPGILRDYEGPEITGGHNINESYKDITFGPTKRPDIQYNDVIK